MNQRGLTLIETLLSVVILSFGIVGVMRPFLSTVDRLDYLHERLGANRILRSKLWDLEEHVARQTKVANLNKHETFYRGSQVYNYRVTSEALGSYDRLQNVHVEMTWAHGSRKKSLRRQTYLLFPPSQKKKANG